MKRKIINFILLLVFLIGCGIFFYPMGKTIYDGYQMKSETKAFDEKSKEISSKEKDVKLKLAKEYNETLTSKGIEDPYENNEKTESQYAYAKAIKIGKSIGYINIPKIHQKMPIYPGTDKYILSIGVGHLKGTSLPIGGLGTHTVLAAHTMYTKLDPKYMMFSDLPKLEVGDKFYISDIAGTLAYEVDRKTDIVPKDLGNLLNIVPGKDYCTLLTCSGQEGNKFTRRLLVRGHRIPYTPPTKVQIEKEEKANLYSQLKQFKLHLIVLTAIILYFIIRLIFWGVRKNKKRKYHEEKN